MSVARFVVGDVFEQMAQLEDGSVDLIVTSPPFLALRSYLPADHPDKGKEIGSEATPAAFLTTLLALTREWRRILAPHGSLAVELGDTYAGSGGGGGDYLPGGMREGQPGFGGTAEQQRDGNAAHWRAKNAERSAWPLDKSLCLLPTLYPASLAYGWNLLDPDDRIEPWRIRNLVVWHRPNPPVGALGDKVRPSTSYVTVACMRRDRWFDLDAERTEAIDQRPRTTNGPKQGDPREVQTANLDTRIGSNPAGAPPLDHWTLDEYDPAEHQSWTIPTQPYAGSHYATFPIALPRRLIRLMCPQHVCRTCGEPRRRITETTNAINKAIRRGRFMQDCKDQPVSSTHFPTVAEVVTLGWSDCGHDNYRRGIVCDPFAGSGTTLAAATEQGRDAIGIDLDERNLDLARQRIGIFLEESS
jgi:site-specific DNA-methyltransferase (cytosine-N4-specific)